ncbi:MAG TPA: carboxypeptidase regulatory-like domain-containing protein [Bryobacteraceae bacterium]|nr:carboxypeptidase regulatory-like domain-containing protein [Bryobacteraceae bacterium]
MNTNRHKITLSILATIFSVVLIAPSLHAADLHGQVKFGGLPLPGATVTASQGDKKLVAVADPDGSYLFQNLADGTWSIEVDMLGFTPVKQDVTVAAAAPASDFELKMKSLDEIKAIATTAPPPASISYTSPASEQTANTAVPVPAGGKKAASNGKKGAPAPPANQNSFQRADLRAQAGAAAPPASDTPSANSPFANQDPGELSQRASDGFLVNGTQNNGAASPFAQAARFGNNVRGLASLYQFGFGFIIDNSALDAKNFSLTGQDTLKPYFNNMTALANFAGPIRIGHLFKAPPTIFLNYQFVHNRSDTTQPALMPLATQRAGDFSQSSTLIYDPTTGAPFAGNVIPASRISEQAKALLNFYPLPNFPTGGAYNYQVPFAGLSAQNNLQARFNKSLTTKDQFFGNFGWQGVSMDTPNVFGFTDTTNTFGISVVLSEQHRFTPRTFGLLQVQFSRFSSTKTPYFANRENVSGDAGVMGNNQEPINWGPPSLNFAASGIYPLSDGLPSLTHNQTTGVSYNMTWIHGRHQVAYGGDYRWQQFNQIAQQNPRGSFTFTGAATSLNGVGGFGSGSDFADFLLGVPDTSSLAFGNADKYFRSTMADVAVEDTWRVGPSLTVTPGLRWDYGSPISELYGRLVNLDIAPGYTAIEPVVGSYPVGTLTGQRYPSSLVRPDLHEFEPSLGLAWRPFPASSVVIRGGYSLRYNTSVYQQIASQMAQQSPLSTSLIASNAVNPLSLANGFYVPPGVITNNFAIDPNFRVGYVQNWQASLQRDLPGSFVLIATYNGIKGTRAVQEFYPNTYPLGVTNPCPTCQSGYIYETSNGNSTREAGSIQLRRRLHNGLTSQVQYTYSKSIDDAALGGRTAPGAAPAGGGGGQGGGQGGGTPGGATISPPPTAVVAQNWLDLSAERGLSTFDQRHLVSWTTQYTTGQGIGGGTLLSGWRGTAFKEWTVVTTINAGTGLPLTPIYETTIPGTGFTGIRPDYTGASVTNAPAGRSLNPEAYAAPSGHWGNAARDSITGPSQFTFNASLARTFRLRDRYTLDLKIDSVNPINHVTFGSWNVIVNSPQQFGTPTAPNAMRSLQTTLRLRF